MLYGGDTMNTVHREPDSLKSLCSEWNSAQKTRWTVMQLKTIQIRRSVPQIIWQSTQQRWEIKGKHHFDIRWGLFHTSSVSNFMEFSYSPSKMLSFLSVLFLFRITKKTLLLVSQHYFSFKNGPLNISSYAQQHLYVDFFFFLIKIYIWSNFF